MSGSCNTGPGVAPTAAGATSFPDDSKRAAAMPVYQFAVRWNDDQASDARWTYLEDVEAARRYAKLLAKESVATGFYQWPRRQLGATPGPVLQEPLIIGKIAGELRYSSSLLWHKALKD